MAATKATYAITAATARRYAAAQVEKSPKDLSLPQCRVPQDLIISIDSRAGDLMSRMMVWTMLSEFSSSAR